MSRTFRSTGVTSRPSIPILTVLISLILLGGCYYEDGFKRNGPSPHKTAFIFPGLVEIDLIQVDSLIYSSSQVTDSIDNQYVVKNLSGSEIDTLKVLCQVYSGAQHTSDHLIFEKVLVITDLKIDGIRSGSFNNAFKTIARKEHINIAIVGGTPFACTSFAGLYTGTYSLFKDKAVQVLGKLNGHVDFNGKMLLEFDTSSDVTFLSGTVLDTLGGLGGFYGGLYAKDKAALATIADTLYIKAFPDSLHLPAIWSLRHKLQFVEDFDSLNFDIVTKKP